MKIIKHNLFPKRMHEGLDVGGGGGEGVQQISSQ